MHREHSYPEALENGIAVETGCLDNKQLIPCGTFSGCYVSIRIIDSATDKAELFTAAVAAFSSNMEYLYLIILKGDILSCLMQFFSILTS